MTNPNAADSSEQVKMRVNEAPALWAKSPAIGPVDMAKLFASP